jgi:hypothetical protein
MIYKKDLRMCYPMIGNPNINPSVGKFSMKGLRMALDN